MLGPGQQEVSWALSGAGDGRAGGGTQKGSLSWVPTSEGISVRCTGRPGCSQEGGNGHDEQNSEERSRVGSGASVRVWRPPAL